MVALCIKRLALARGFEALNEQLVALEPALLLLIQKKLTCRTREQLLHHLTAVDSETDSVISNNVTRKEVCEVKGFQKPPRPIRDGLAPAHCILMGLKPQMVRNDKTGRQRPDWWTPYKRYLGYGMMRGRFVKDDMLGYDRSVVTSQMLHELCKYTDLALLEPEYIRR